METWWASSGWVRWPRGVLPRSASVPVVLLGPDPFQPLVPGASLWDVFTHFCPIKTFDVFFFFFSAVLSNPALIGQLVSGSSSSRFTSCQGSWFQSRGGLEHCPRTREQGTEPPMLIEVQEGSLI